MRTYADHLCQVRARKQAARYAAKDHILASGARNNAQTTFGEIGTDRPSAYQSRVPVSVTKVRSVVRGYRPAAMVETPWGDAAALRERKLRPGRGTPRDEAERNQRERLFAAMVATVAEKGYEATTVADLVELSGVSRSAFYRHFDDKQACFLAAVEAMVEPTLKRVGADESVAAGHRARPPGLRLADPADRLPARRGEDVHRRDLRRRAGGRRAGRPHDRLVDRARCSGCSSRCRSARGCRIELVRAFVGGIQKVIHKRLYRGQEEELLGPGAAALGVALPLPGPPGPAAGDAPPQRQGRCPSPSARRWRPRRSGSCAPSPRWSPTRATRTPPWPRWSNGRAPRSAPSTNTSRTRKTRS